MCTSMGAKKKQWDEHSNSTFQNSNFKLQKDFPSANFHKKHKSERKEKNF